MSYYAVVERTARHGLVESKESRQSFDRWMAIWSLDIVCEAIEAKQAIFGDLKNKYLVELGDVIWGVAAVGLLTGIPEARIFEGYSRTVPETNARRNLGNSLLLGKGDAIALIDAAGECSDYLKKVARDSREIDQDAICRQLRCVVSVVRYLCDPLEALAAVDQKLRERFPAGYTPEASINRVV
jgi:hypothetical protein